MSAGFLSTARHSKRVTTHLAKDTAHGMETASACLGAALWAAFETSGNEGKGWERRKDHLGISRETGSTFWFKHQPGLGSPGTKQTKDFHSIFLPL